MKLELRSRPLDASPLAALAGDRDSGARWYEPRPDAEGWGRRVDETAAGFQGGAWLSKLAPAFRAGGVAARRLERVASEAGVLITTGQQPGLFGGPLYTWFKAMSAHALAVELERRTGVATAAVFWAATDDSDFAEASETTVGVTGGAEVIGIDPPGTDTRIPMSLVPLGDVSAQLEALTRACGSAPNVAALDAVRRAYVAGATVGDAYVRLLRSLLEPLGVAVLDASHPAVRNAGLPLLRQALERADALQDALKRRANELKSAGHRAQVAHVAGRTLVFRSTAAGRERIRVKEAAAAIDSGDGILSPNVLLRPVMEREIMPTVAYVGGPGEVAYFAQVGAVADGLGVKRPLIVPRWSGVIVEPHVRAILDRIDADVDDFATPHAIETRVARKEMPEEIASALGKARNQVEIAMAELEQADESADILPAAVVEGSRRQLLHKLDRLERRYLAATKRRGSELLTDVATARGSLFPGGKPQERALNVVPFLARYGDELWDGIMAKAREHAESLL